MRVGSVNGKICCSPLPRGPGQASRLARRGSDALSLVVRFAQIEAGIRAHVRSEQYFEAAAIARDTLEQARRVFDARDVRLIVPLKFSSDLALILGHVSRGFDLASEAWRLSLHVSEFDPQRGLASVAAASALRAQGFDTETHPLWDQAISIFGHESNRDVHRESLEEAKKGRDVDAEVPVKRVHIDELFAEGAGLEETGRQRSCDYLTWSIRTAMALIESGRYSAATEQLRAAEELGISLCGQFFYGRQAVYRLLTRIALQRGSLGDAGRAAMASVEHSKAAFGQMTPHFAGALEDFAEVKAQQGEKVGARRLVAMAQWIHEKAWTVAQARLMGMVLEQG